METEAARTAGIDPDRISFTVTIRIARDHDSNQASITTPGLSQARSSQAIRDILDDLLPTRRDRQCQRVKKPPKNTFPAKKRGQARPPSKVTYNITVTRKSLLTCENALTHRHCNKASLTCNVKLNTAGR